MKKRLILICVVITAGLVTGYFSSTIYNLIWPARAPEPAVLSALKENQSSFISGNEAIKAVKDLPSVKKLIEASELEGSQLVFAVEQEPTDEYPIWLIRVEEISRSGAAETRYFQIEAESGRVLDFQTEDLHISGIKLSMTRAEVEVIQGKPRKINKLFDIAMNQTIRIYNYPGLEVMFDGKGKVAKVTASKPEYEGPKGVKIGDSQKDIIKVFGKARISRTNLLVYSSPDDETIQFIVRLDNDNNVSEISIKKATGNQESY